MVRVAFAETIWEPALANVDRPSRIRSMIFAPSGNVVSVTSRPRNRESYHLAALIGQHLLQLSRNEVAPDEAAWSQTNPARGVVRRSVRVAVATLCIAAAVGAVSVA